MAKGKQITGKLVGPDLLWTRMTEKVAMLKGKLRGLVIVKGDHIVPAVIDRKGVALVVNTLPVIPNGRKPGEW